MIKNFEQFVNESMSGKRETCMDVIKQMPRRARDCEFTTVIFFPEDFELEVDYFRIYKSKYEDYKTYKNYKFICEHLAVNYDFDDDGHRREFWEFYEKNEGEVSSQLEDLTEESQEKVLEYLNTHEFSEHEKNRVL